MYQSTMSNYTPADLMREYEAQQQFSQKAPKLNTKITKKAHAEPDGQLDSSSSSRNEISSMICVVCGSAANGYNFDAVTCESCKAFFRRNAFRSVVI